MSRRSERAVRWLQRKIAQLESEVPCLACLRSAPGPGETCPECGATGISYETGICRLPGDPPIEKEAEDPGGDNGERAVS